jgi:hypothetical protein
MSSIRSWLQAILAASSLFAGIASAQSYNHSVYLDLDNNAGTGCSVATAAGAVNGAEARVSATVTGQPPMVTASSVAMCAGAAFGPATPLAANYPVGLDNGTGGSDVIEMATSLTGLGPGGTARFVYVSTSATGADQASGTIVLPGGVVAPSQPILVPATGIIGLLLLAGLVLWLARRHPGFGSSMALLLLLGAGVVWAANFVADGQVGDWTGVPPLNTDLTDDSTSGETSIEIVAVFAAHEAGNLFLRVDVLEAEPAANVAPVATDAAFAIAENSANTTAVGTVVATDADVGQVLTYAITAGNTGGAFAIDANTGAITVANMAALDFETTPNFALSVTATDNGTPAFSDTAAITVTVTDVNEAPTLADAARAVAQSSAAGTQVGAPLGGVDPDTTAPNNTLTYAITAGNTNNAFAIDGNGQLTVLTASEVAGPGTFNLTVSVTDGGALSDTAAVTVTVTDANDAPVFGMPAYNFSLPENSVAATAVGATSATDPDVGQTLTYAITAGNTGGAFGIDAAGNITVINSAALDFEGSAVFNLVVSATDNGAPPLSGNANVTVTLTDGNDAPVANDAALTVPENSAMGTAVGSATATDPDASAPNNTLSYAITGGNTGGAFAIDANTGAITVADGSGLNFESTPPFSLTITVTDGGALSDTGTVTISLTDANDAPTLADDTRNVVEASPAATPVGAPVAGVDPDASAPNNTLTYAITGGNTGNAFQIDANSGQITVQTQAAVTLANSPFALVVTVTDGGALSDTGTITVTVSDVNDAPSFIAGGDQMALEDAGAQVGTPDPWATNIQDNDPTIQTLTFVVSNDNNALFAAQPAISPTGTLTYTPAANANGSATVSVQLMDDGGTALGGVDTSAVQTFTITITPVNDAPSFLVGPDEGVLENAGAQNVTPWATALLAGPADEAGQTLTFNIVGNTNAALFAAGPTIAADGSLSYTPAAATTGSADITVSVSDNGGVTNGGTDTSATQTFTISVNNVNDAPSFMLAGNPATVLEDAGAQSVPAFASAITDNDAPAVQVLTFIVTGNTNAALFSAAPAIDPATGELTYTPAADANGSAQISVVLMDDGGTASGGVDTSATQNFTITVTAVNDVPSFTAGPDENILENAGAQVVSSWATAMSAGPADEAGQTLSFNITNNTNAALFSVQPSVDASGQLSYTPNNNLSGSAIITLNVMDNGGVANGGVDTSATQQFTITVADVNAAPSFTAGPNQMVNEDAGAQVVNPWATAIDDGDAALLQALTFNVVNNSNPGLFAAGPAISATGVLTYTPAANFSGVATIEITLSDDGGTANGGADTSASQSFTITVNAVNDMPTFTAANPPAVNEDSAAQSIPAFATFNAGAPDEAAQTVVAYSVTNISNAALFSVAPAVAANGTLSYTPAAGMSGSSTFDVSVQDSGGTANGGVDTSAVQTFTITVNLVNDAPSFTPGASPVVNEDAGAQTVNPWATAIDDGDAVLQTLTFNITNNTNPALFSAAPAISPAGVLTYTPAADTSGTATISVVLSDDGGTANGGVDSAAQVDFTITVNSVNDVPSFSAGGSQVVNEDSGPQAIDPWATALDPGPADEAGQTLSFSITGNTNAALFSAGPTVSATGALTYTPAANASGVATISVAIVDNGGTANGGIDTSAAQNFTITVNNVNDVPVFTAGANQSVAEDAGAQVVDPWATGVDDGDPGVAQILSFQITANDNPALFSAGPTISPTGALSYTPALNAFGVANITVRLVDNGGTANGGIDTSATQNFTITITPVNDAPVAGSEAFDTLGNTELRIDMGATGTPHVLDTTVGGTGVRENDMDPVENDPIAVSGIVGCVDAVAPFDCMLGSGSLVSMNTDGTFTFRPSITLANGAPTVDSFSYVLTDAPVVGVAASANGVVTINVYDKIWYVRQGAAGVGRSDSPLGSFTGINAAGGVGDSDGVGDYIFVHNSGALSSSIELEGNQRLLGEGVALSIPRNLNTNGSPTNLVPAGTRPVVTSAVNTVSAGNAMPVEIRGLSLSSTAAFNAIDLTTSAAANTGSATLTISENTITGAGAEGIDVNYQSTTLLNLVIAGNTWLPGTHVGNAVDINNSGATANSLAINFSNNGGMVSNGTAVNINGGTATRTVVTGFATNAVSGDTVTAGIIISNVTFDSTVGGAVNQVVGNTLAIGQPGNPVGGSGLSVITSAGDVMFADLDIAAATGTGLAVSGTGGGLTFGVTPVSSGGTSTVDADNGAALDLNTVTADLRLSFLQSNTSLSGVNLATVAGQVSAPAGSSIVKAAGAGTAFSMSSSSATVSYAGSLNVTAGAGVSFTTNTGSLLLNGGMVLSTGANVAFNATGGGTVSVCDEAACAPAATGGLVNSIATTTATAVNIVGTNIGAGGIELRSVNTTGAGTNGIVLNNTGVAGGLKVRGNGGVCSSAGTCTGGAIQNKSGDAVSLNLTSGVELVRMFIDSNDGSGVFGDDVTGFTLTESRVTNNTDSATGLEASLRFIELLGTCSITNSVIAGSQEDEIRMTPASGVLTNLTISGSTIGPNLGVAGNGITLSPTLTAQVTLTVNNTVFDDIAASALIVNGTDTTVRTLNVTGSAFSDNNSGLHLLGSNSSDFTYSATTNSFLRHGLNPVQISFGTTSTNASDTNGTINGNTIGDGNLDSGATDLHGIAVESQGDADSILSILNNTVRHTDIDGIFVQSRLDNDADAEVGLFDLAVTDNSVSAIDDNSAFPFGVSYGVRIESRNTTEVCMDMAGNAAASVGGQEHFRVRQRDTSNFGLERLTDGDGTPGEEILTLATIEAHIVAQNDAGSTADATQQTVGDGYIERANDACRTP